MNCAQCNHENAPTARFCSDCGSPLERRCPTCDASQRLDAKFCDQCGAALTSAAPAAPPKRPSAVRKQVTAMFADLVGSTAFGEQVDPEAARAAMSPYFAMLRSTVEDHAGTVVKFTGDGVFAVFGLPEVAEDDARRAVAAGQDLQRRFAAFAASVRDRHGVDLGLRVGINSGEIVVDDADEDLVGDVLNTAARLEAACAPGHVLVGEDTWRLTRSSVRYEVLGEVMVKGKAEPIATFQVAELPDAPIEEHLPFVGREQELASLIHAFDEACDSPVLRLVTVVGDPGVGKTRLASEVCSATSARSFDLRFERRGSTTFGPIGELLRLVTDGTDDGVSRLLDGHAEGDRLAPILRSFLGFEATRSTEESFWGVRRLLEHLTELHGPLLVVVDDIQWAEPLFWDLLDHLVEWTEAPVLVVALARPELRELRPELTRAGGRVAASIALDGLDAEQTHELAARLLDADELPRELVDRVPESTGGNPLFIRELVNMLVEDGTLERNGERWHLTIDVDAIDVPPTILTLLASRVERLPEDERQAIELASVIGTDFDRGALAAVAAEDGATGPLGVVLDRLRRRDLVEPTGSWAGDHPVYRFHHVLVRDAAYRRLLKERRATLHELVGRHVDEHHVSSDETDVVVAHHFEQVVQYRRDLGIVDASTDDLGREAVLRLRRSADAALAREDLPAAGSAAQRALELVDGASAERDELLLVGCEAFLSSGDTGRAEGLVDELAGRSTDARLAAWADCFRAQRWSLTDPDRLVEAAEVADSAAATLASLGDSGGVAKARLVRAACLARLGRVGDSEGELDLALNAARDAADRRRTVAVLGAAPAAALWGPSSVSRAGGRCLDVLRLLRITTASPAVETTSVRCQAVLEALRGRLDSAREKLELSRSTSVELGLQQGLFETELYAGFVELWVGDAAAAEPHLRAAHEGLGRLGIGADAGQAAALLARTLLDRGDIEAADALASEALEAAGQNLQTAIASRSALAEVRAAQGRHHEATSLVDEAIAIAERTDAVLDHALAVEASARVQELAGDHRAARSAHAEAQRLLAEKGVTLGRTNAGAMDGLDDEGTPAVAEDPTSAAPVRMNPPAAVAEQPDTTRRDDRPASVGAAAGRDSSEAGPGSSGWDVVEGAASAWLANDEAAWRRCYAADFAGAGREQLSPQRTDVGLDEWATTAFDLRRNLTELHVTSERVAQRGDHWFVSRNVGTADGNEIGFVFVSQVVEGRIRRETIFDPTQIDEAVALADQGFDVENGLGEDHWIRDVRPAMYSVDPDLIERCFHDEYRFRDQRRMGWHDLTRDDLLDAIRANPDPFVVSVPMVWRISESGIVLHRVETTPDGLSVSGWIAVVEFRDQLVHRMDTYDENDLTSALAHYSAIDGNAGPAERFVVSRAASAGPQLDTVVLPFADDCVMNDHRPPGLGRSALSEFIDSAGHIAPTTTVVQRILDHVGDLSLYEAQFVTNEEDVAWHAFHIERSGEDGLAHEVDVFGSDQLDEARTRFDQLVAEGAYSAEAGERRVNAEPNAAWNVAMRFGAFIRIGDRDRMDAMTHPDYVITNHGRLESVTPEVVAGDSTEHHAETFTELGFTTRTELIAVRADDLCLIRYDFSPDDWHVPRLLLVRCEDGMVRRADWYDIEQLDEAYDQLNEWWAALGGPADIPEFDRRFRTAFRDGPVDALRSLTADDFVSVDHRPLGFGTRSRDAWVESLASIVGRAMVINHDVDCRGPAELVRASISLDGDVIVDGYVVSVRRDGLMTRNELFELSQRGEARARFGALAGADDDPHALARNDVHTEGEPDAALARDSAIDGSRLWRWNRAVHQRMVDGIADGYDEMFSPGARFEVRRRRSPASEGPISTLIDQHIVRWVAIGLERVDAEMVEEHGDDRCVLRVTVVTSAGDRSTLLFLTELDADGRASRLALFDHDQIGDALSELRQVAPGGADAIGALHAALHDADGAESPHVDRVSLAIALGPLDAFAACFAPDVVVVDQRTMGLGTRDLSAFVESNTALVGNVVAWTAETIDVSETASLTRVEVRSTVDESSWAMLLLTEYAGPGTDDLIARWTQFDVDDGASALEAFRSLGADRSGLPALTNSANDVMQRYHAARSAGDVDAMAAILHPDFEYVEATAAGQALDAAPADREQVLGGFPEFWAKFGPPSAERDVVAVRGNSLIMSTGVEAYGDDALPFCGLAEIQDGLVRRTTVFTQGQFSEELDELDRRWVELGGSADLAEISRRWRTATMQPVLDRADLPVSDDFVTIDHRPSSLGRRSLDEYLESTGPIAPVEEWHVVRYFDDRPPFHFAQIRVLDAEGSTWDSLQVCRRDSAELVEVHVFDLEQFAEAQALFDALTAPADHPEVPELARPVQTEASRVAAEWVQAWIDRDAALMRQLLADDLEHHGRNDAVLLGPDALVEVALADDLLPSGEQREQRTLAVRGDHLALDVEVDQVDGRRLVRFGVFEVAGGTVLRIHRFGDEQLADAYRRLDERYREIVAESSGAKPAGPPELTSEVDEISLQVVAGQAGGDIDASASLVHEDELSNREVELSRENLRIWPRDADHVDRFFEPDFEWIVRRTGSIKLDGDLSSYLDVAEFWTSVDATIGLEVLAVRGDVLSLKRYTVRTASGDEQVIYNVAELGPTGRWLRIVVSGEDQLGAAVVELERRWAELNGDPLDEFGHRWVTAYLSRDIAEVERLLAPSFETVDHRPIGLGRRTRAGYLDSNAPVLELGVVFVFARLIETADRCALKLASALVRDDVLFKGLMLTLIDDEGRAESIETFDITQLDEARRRFHELTSVEPSPLANAASELGAQMWRAAELGELAIDPAGPPLTNVAAQLVERMWRADARGDVDEMARVLDPGFRSENRRRAWVALDAPAGDYEALVSRTTASDRRQDDGDLDRLADRSILAIRGDDLAAGTGVADNDGYHMPFAGVAESVEGRLMWLGFWDEPDVSEALDELDRRWVERGGPAPLVEAMTRFRRLGRDGDVAGVEAFVSLDLESIDHRALGMGLRGYRDWVDSMTPLAGRCEFVMHEVLEHTDRIGLIRGTVSQADEGSWELLYLLRVDGDGRVDRYEIFEWSDVDLARTRFEELVTESSPGPDDAMMEQIIGLNNTADRLSRRVLDAQARCDVDEVDALLHPHYVIDERSPAFAALGGRLETKAEYLDDLREYIQRVSGDVQTTTDRSVVAVRGDDLCLSRGVMVRDGFGHPYLALVEVDEGLIRRVVFWDETQFHDAIDELNRAWVERGGSDKWANFDRRFSSIFQNGSADDLEAVVAPDFESIDHRPLGLGRRDRDEWVATADAVVGRATARTHSVLVHGPARLGRVSFVLNDDGSTLMDGLAIGVLGEDGAYQRQELFALDQWEDARARFDELGGR